MQNQTASKCLGQESGIWLQKLMRLIRFTAIVSHLSFLKFAQPKGGGGEIDDLSQSWIVTVREPHKCRTPEDKVRASQAQEFLLHFFL